MRTTGARGAGVAVVGIVLVLTVLGGTAACSEEAPQGEGTTVPIVQSSGADAEGAIAQVFAELAQAAAPMPVYGLAALPEGVSLAPTWLPVIEASDPGSYEGEARPNPFVSGAPGADPEIQIILECGEGWLVIVENFRGDLGDVVGQDTEAAGGKEARLYEVAGGLLVQWSDGGRWYGVFGRDVPREQVITLAESLVVIPLDDGD